MTKGDHDCFLDSSLGNYVFLAFHVRVTLSRVYHAGYINSEFPEGEKRNFFLSGPDMDRGGVGLVTQ